VLLHQRADVQEGRVQAQPVVAEIHLQPVDEGRVRAEGSPPNPRCT